MERNRFNRRVAVLALVLVLAVGWLGSAMYDLQIVHGAEYAARAQSRVVEKQSVEAARGEITDRYGRVLVSNRVVYQVTLNTSVMKEARNEVILALTQTSREEGVAWTDTLPITAEPPFQFTTDAPYYTTTTDEEGNTQRTLTRLGKLAVKMKWISGDPTQEPKAAQPAQAQEEGGVLESILGFFGFGGGEAAQEPAQPQEASAVELPGAEELLERMCISFGLGEEQEQADGSTVRSFGGLTEQQLRDAAGVNYELYLRSKEVYGTAYIYAEDVDIDFISRVKEQGLRGVEITSTTVREYNTEYAAHLLGRVALMSPEEWEVYREKDEDGDGVADYQMDDSIGKEGVEKAFESYLRGTSGTRAVERSTSGKVVSESWLTPPEPGDNVVLTLDLDLQKKVEDTLAESLPNLKSEEVEGAACVVLDVNDGSVLASASYPTYSLANYSQEYSENASDPLNPFLNRATMGTYAPGSTFKMVTAVAGLEEEIITPTTIIKDLGRYTYWSTTNAPQCWIYRQYGRTHGDQNVSQAITNSCNYYFYEVGRLLGIDRLVEYATMFGLGQKTGLEVPESAGVMAGPEYTESMGGTWYEGSVLSVAIGQESSQFTPIQLASYIATLVNGGTRYSTHLLKEVKSSDYSQVLHTREPEALSSIDIAEENLEAVKKGMLDLTTDGSVSRYFQDLGFQVGAKTGSAQISAQTESNAVFVCFAPYDDPEIAVSIVVEHGGSGSELGAMAASILQYYFSTQETREEIRTENTLVR